MRSKAVKDMLFSERYAVLFPEEHIRDSVYSYLSSGGKGLRPALLLFSCGAVGEDEEKALPASAGVELFHTWTLVHDDIIDRDHKRRGMPTVHVEFRDRAYNEFGFTEEEAEHYGVSVAILAGDMQHGWSNTLFADLSGVDPAVSVYLLKELNSRVLSTLLEGELLDVQYSGRPVDSLCEEDIIDMMWKKTGVLYEFCGMAGAVIGIGAPDLENDLLRALSCFAGKCGVAFQMQDDILGVIGDEEKLGKPVGSDIREGKKTLVLYFALKNATEGERKYLLSILGNQDASESDLLEVNMMLEKLGGVEETRRLAEKYTREAASCLDRLPGSDYRELLLTLSEYIVRRNL